MITKTIDFSVHQWFLAHEDEPKSASRIFSVCARIIWRAYSWRPSGPLLPVSGAGLESTLWELSSYTILGPFGGRGGMGGMPVAQGSSQTRDQLQAIAATQATAVTTTDHEESPLFCSLLWLCAVFHCIYVPYHLYSSSVDIFWWTFRLFSCCGYCEWCCY